MNDKHICILRGKTIQVYNKVNISAKLEIMQDYVYKPSKPIEDYDALFESNTI